MSRTRDAQGGMPGLTEATADSRHGFGPGDDGPAMERCLDALAGAADRVADRRVVMLPDFYLDHLVPLGRTDAFRADVERIATRGGGNRVTPDQFYRIGGNATNTAYALARLGVPTTLVTTVDAMGRAMLERAFAGTAGDLSRLKDTARSSTTVALQFGAHGAEGDEEEGGGDSLGHGANVMLSDPGPLADFGPDDLDATDWRLIEEADLVGITNWAQSLHGGTELLRTVVERADRAGTRTYLDTGDPSHRGDDVDGLLDPAITGRLTVWAMNDSELHHFARRADPHIADDVDLETAAQGMAKRYPGRIDVHTATGALSVEGGKAAQAGTFAVQPVHRTGAGDAWNAGNMFAQLLGLDGSDRLVVANAVAAMLLTEPRLTPPDVEALEVFLRQHRPRRPVFA